MRKSKLRFNWANKMWMPANQYDGASRKGQLRRWMPGSYGPNVVMVESLETLRDRSRALVRNNAWAAGIIESYTANLIGTGIRPNWNFKSTSLPLTHHQHDELKKELQRYWNLFSRYSDFDGHNDIYGLQTLVTREVMESGECFLIKKPRSLKANIPVPLQFQVVEADFLDINYSQSLASGNQIRMGVEFNKKNQRVAYWMWKFHPNDDVVGQNERIRISAKNVIHVFKPVRAGQVRGVPWLTSIMATLRMLEQYMFAELTRKQAAAMVVFWIKNMVGDDPNDATRSTSESSPDDFPADMMSLNPGSTISLADNEEVDMTQPADVGANYESWVQQELRNIAVGAGVLAQHVSGDYADANKASLRAALIEFRRKCEVLQKQLITFQLCQPLVAHFMDTLNTYGLVDIPEYSKYRADYLSILWQPPRWQSVDPDKDAATTKTMLRLGLTSLSEQASMQGRDVEDLLEEIAKDQALMNKLNLIFDSNPGQTATNGSFQSGDESHDETTNTEVQ